MNIENQTCNQNIENQFKLYYLDENHLDIFGDKNVIIFQDNKNIERYQTLSIYFFLSENLFYLPFISSNLYKTELLLELYIVLYL